MVIFSKKNDLRVKGLIYENTILRSSSLIGASLIPGKAAAGTYCRGIERISTKVGKLNGGAVLHHHGLFYFGAVLFAGNVQVLL